MGGLSIENITSIGSGQTFTLNYQHAVVCRSPVTNTVIVLTEVTNDKFSVHTASVMTLL